MGNIQTSLIGSQIFPAESYVQDIDDLRFLRSLGDTRFMKTACVDHKGELSVVKLFVLNDDFKQFNLYINAVNLIRRKLRDCPNCLTFTRPFPVKRCILLLRPYWKYTLYDRLSTRPFLLDIEKQWIAFQLLKALSQFRMNGVCHGDIKAQNVLISSSNWVQVSDFAPYKPAFVPYDNPSTFTFFFDTSRKRTCYLAPERFKKAEDLTYLHGNIEELVNISEGLTEAMDIFAMGCVLVELLTDGRHVAFNLSQGIDYTRMDERVADTYLQKLLSVCPEEFRELLAIMLDRDPKRRQERFDKYTPCSSKLFPQLFEYFLYRYFKDLLTVQKPDELILKLFVEFSNYRNTFEKSEANAIVLIINMVTANIRSCQSMSTKMDGILLLKWLSDLCDSALIADRVIPYLVALLHDYHSQVRGEAIFAITEILDGFDFLPDDETRLLVDYVFPRLKQLTDDPCDYVKIVLATCLGRLAVISLRFFNDASTKINNDMSAITELQGTNVSDEEIISRIIDSEKTALQEAIGEIFSNLCDSCDAARQCLFSQENLTFLCEFFGSNKAYDNVLMHIMTLPNSKFDWTLRATFFDCYPIVARKLNTVQNSKLMPFIQQAFHDPEEFVTYSALLCLYNLFDNNLLDKSAILALIPEIVFFLIHPNKWFRIQVVSILSVLDSIFSVADVYSKLLPMVRPYLTEPLIRLNDKEVVFSCLVEPISRQIWDLIVGCEQIENLLYVMEKKRTIDKLGGGRHSFFSAGTSGNSMSQLINRVDLSRSMVSDVVLEPIIKKLNNLGMNEYVEDQLVSVQSLLKKLNASKQGDNATATKDSEPEPLLLKLSHTKRMVYSFIDGSHKYLSSTSFLSTNILEAAKEWNDFSSTDPIRNRLEVPFDMTVLSRMSLAEAFAQKQMRFRKHSRIARAISNETQRDQGECSSSTTPQSSIMSTSTTTRTSFSNLLTSSRLNLSNAVRRPELHLVSHLHEHSEAVIELSVQPRSNRFASCSADNTVKIWTTSQVKLDESPATVSLMTFNFPTRTNSLAFMQANDLHLVMGRGNELFVHDVDGNRLLRSFSVDNECDGHISKVATSDHLIYTLTHHGVVYCFDLRASSNSKNQFTLQPVFMQRIRNTCGLATGFSVDCINNHWMLLTTSSSTTNNIMLWDLRFSGLEVLTWPHPSKEALPFRSWSYAENDKTCDHIFTNSAKDGELSLWSLSMQERTEILWPGSEYPLNYVNDLVTTSLISCPTFDGVFTGDSEGSLRYWNMKGQVEKSNYLCGPYRKFAGCWTPSDVICKNGRIEDRKQFPRVEYYCSSHVTERVQIQVEKRLPVSSSDFDMQMVPHVSESHRNAISDLNFVGPNQLVSADRGGAIKIWKIYIS